MVRGVIPFETDIIKDREITNNPLRKKSRPDTPITLLILVDTNDSRTKLPRRDLAIKQDVRLAVRAMLELRQPEVRRDPANQSSAAPDVAALSSEIPSRGVKHLRSEIDHRNLCNIVRRTTDTRAERAQTDRRCLGDNGIRNRTHGAGEDERDQYSQNGLGIVGRLALGYGSAHA